MCVCVRHLLGRGVAGSSTKLVAGPTGLSGDLVPFLLGRGAGSKGSCLIRSSDPWRPPRLESSRSPSRPRAMAHGPSSGVPAEGAQHTCGAHPPGPDSPWLLRHRGWTCRWLITGFWPPDDSMRVAVSVFAVCTPRGQDCHLPFPLCLPVPLPCRILVSRADRCALHASLQRF